MKYLPLLALIFCASTVHAEQNGATLPIRVNIIQCGEIERIIEACERESACCHFVPPETQDVIQVTERMDVAACSINSLDTNGRFNPLCVQTNE